MVEFRVLGPLEVRGPAGVADLGSSKQRLVLALLLLRAGEFVSRDALIDALWPEQPPPSARQTIESYVSRLRGALRRAGIDGDLIEWASQGYRFALNGHRLDRESFDVLTREGSEALARGDYEVSLTSTREALALWRGPALAGLAEHAGVRADLAALEERRVQALETWAEAKLALGHHLELVAPLRAEAERHPAREGVTRLLMLALYRAGRQADALEAYRRTRRHLVDELGLEPGHELRELEARILRQDPALAAPLAAENAAGGNDHTEPAARRARPHRAVIAFVTAVLAAGVGLLLVSLVGGGRTGADGFRGVLRSPAVGVLDPATGRTHAAIALPAVPDRIASGAGGDWATAYDAGELFRIDRRHGVVTQTIRVGHGPTGVAVAGGDVWVADSLDNSLARVDGATSRVVQRVPVATGPSEVAAGGGALWVSSPGAATISHVDPQSGAVLGATRLRSAPGALAVGAGAVWVAEREAGVVARLDPNSGRVVDEIHVGSGPSALAVGPDGVWVANQLDSTVSLIDPARDAVTLTRAVSGAPTALAVVGSQVWVAARDAPLLTRVDSSGETRLVTLPSPAVALASGTGGLVAGVRGSAAGHRGGTLVVQVSGPLFAGVDAHYCCDLPPNVRALSYDSLLAYSTAPGSVGALVPDLAVQLPRPEAGGRAYTFQLRPGLRYWTGAPVRASDVRRGLERAAESNGVYAGNLASLPGALACHANPRRCDLRRAVSADDRAGTITLHLSHPDPALVEQLADPTTAPTPPGRGVTPGTGPYRIARFVPRHELDLERNPFFHPWAPAAQPSGYPDRIVWRMGGRPADNVSAVLAGRADYTWDPPTPRQRGQIELRAPGRLHLVPLADTDYLTLNTRVPPFDDVRARRAVNFAVDRRAIARLFGGFATPTCQFIPATVAGYAPYCPYTRSPSRTGRWSAPDLRRARALIAASGTAGSPVTIWTQPGLPLEAPTGRYFVRLLRKLGYRAHVRVLPHNRWAAAINDPHRHPQVVTQGWIDPRASVFISRSFGCAAWNPPIQMSNHAEFCDPPVDRLARSAERVEPTDPVAANRLWARADRRLTDAAPAVATVQESSPDLLSRRTGDYQYAPSTGVVLQRLWVR